VAPLQNTESCTAWEALLHAHASAAHKVAGNALLHFEAALLGLETPFGCENLLELLQGGPRSAGSCISVVTALCNQPLAQD